MKILIKQMNTYPISFLLSFFILSVSACQQKSIKGTYKRVSGSYRYDTFIINKLNEDKKDNRYSITAYNEYQKKYTAFGQFKNSILQVGFLTKLKFLENLQGFKLSDDNKSLYQKQSNATEVIFPINKTAIHYLNPDSKLDQKTEIKKSQIPGAGNGLFARVKIKNGEVIGNYGGRLIYNANQLKNDEYIAGLLRCTWKQLRPYIYIDGKGSKSHVTRINFAPNEINGIKTNFQNAKMKPLCIYPYLVFVAKRDIYPGEEIWSTYGTEYKYERFMKYKAVQNFFCTRLKIDCSKKFVYKY